MIEANSNIKEAKIEAVIIRADGTREHLGTLVDYKKTSLLDRIKNFFRGKVK